MTAADPAAPAVPVYVVLGAGPGLGLAASRRFAVAGCHAVLVGRTAEETEPLAQTLRDEGFAASAAGVNLLDEADVRGCVGEIAEQHGRVDVLHFNPSAWREKSPLELTVADLLEDVTLGVGALLPALQAAAPVMPAGARVLATGSMAADKPYAGAASLGVQKAALRNLIISVDATLVEHGVRAVAVQINGALKPEGPFGPPAIAEALYAATTRADVDWTVHVDYNG